MTANRLSWVGVAVVVLVVGGLVVRTLRQDEGQRVQSPSAPGSTTAAPQSEALAGGRAAAPGEHVPSSVYRAKEALLAKGYYRGPLNNDFDPTVIEAVKKFQKDAGMPATGRLDPKTYAALGVVVRAHRPATP